MKRSMFTFITLAVVLGTATTAFAQGKDQALTGAAASPASQVATGEGSQPNKSPDAELKEKKLKEEAEEAEDKPKSWYVNASVSSRVGQGTFVDVSGDSEFEEDLVNADNAFDLANISYGFGAGYTLGDFTLSGGIAWVKFLTVQGDPNLPRTTRVQDPQLTLSWAGYTFDTPGITVSSSASVSFPVSVFSRATSQYFSTGANVNVTKRFLNRVTVSLFVSGGRIFHEFTSPIADLEEAGEGNVLFRAGGSEALRNALVAVGTRNTQYTFGLGGSLGVSLVEKLALGVSYSFGQYWSYDTGASDLDELSNPNATAGRQSAQFIGTSVSLSYPFLDYFRGSLGVRSGFSPKTNDNSSFRFPFWNFEGAAANRSSLFASVSARY